MTQKDPCYVICDITQSKECKNNVQRHDSSVWQPNFMCLNSDYIVQVAK